MLLLPGLFGYSYGFTEDTIVSRNLAVIQEPRADGEVKWQETPSDAEAASPRRRAMEQRTPLAIRLEGVACDKPRGFESNHCWEISLRTSARLRFCSIDAESKKY